jgi:hypothetical protein
MPALAHCPPSLTLKGGGSVPQSTAISVETPCTPPNSSENNLGKKILGLFLILTSNNHMSKKKFKTKNRAQSFGDAML